MKNHKTFEDAVATWYENGGIINYDPSSISWNVWDTDEYLRSYPEQDKNLRKICEQALLAGCMDRKEIDKEMKCFVD